MVVVTLTLTVAWPCGALLSVTVIVARPAVSGVTVNCVPLAGETLATLPLSIATLNEPL